MFRLLPAFFLLAYSVFADDLDTEVKRLISAYALVEQNAADPVSSEQAFYQGVIPGMLRRLDPHSVFFDPQQFDQLKQLETSTRKGFGSVVSVLPGRVIVLQTTPGTPSAKSGMSPGDEILSVNGIRLDRLDLDQLIGLLQQSKQQPAALVVRRPGSRRETGKGTGRSAAIRFSARGTYQWQKCERLGDCGRCAARSRPRGNYRRGKLRQRPGAERVSSGPVYRPRPDNGALLHSE